MNKDIINMLPYYNSNIKKLSKIDTKKSNELFEYYKYFLTNIDEINKIEIYKIIELDKILNKYAIDNIYRIEFDNNLSIMDIDDIIKYDTKYLSKNKESETIWI